jgi:hypothetical protein
MDGSAFCEQARKNEKRNRRDMELQTDARGKKIESDDSATWKIAGDSENKNWPPTFIAKPHRGRIIIGQNLDEKKKKKNQETKKCAPPPRWRESK